MGIRCVLYFNKNGSLTTGFDEIILRIEDSNRDQLIQEIGKLPPAPKIVELRNAWSSSILECTRYLPRHLRSSPLRTIKPSGESYSSSEYIEKVTASGKNLETRLNNWLRSEDFIPIRDKLLFYSHDSQIAQLIIETEDLEIKRLPWHIWECSEQLIKFTEVAIGSIRYTKLPLSNKAPRTQVRILAILGDSSNIDVTQDRKILENNIDAHVEFLVEPSRDNLSQHLADKQGWDILFFAGHSRSQVDGKDGEIYLNKNDRLKISELNKLLQDAISRGLTLAILNSCDGIGIANNLANLHIPYVIVMREPVPDRVAQDFFKELIKEFNQNQQSLSLAVTKARKHLHSLEHIYPCASWLPLLCHNASAKPLTWKELPGFQNQQRLQLPQPNQSQDSTQTIVEPPLPPDCINLCLIGDRASGKTTYIASLLHNPNPQGSNIINSIRPLNQKARELKALAKNKIEQGLKLEPTSLSDLSKPPHYSLEIILKKELSWLGRTFNSKPQLEYLKLTFKDYAGEFFIALGQQDSDISSQIENYLKDRFQANGIMLLIASTSNSQDAIYAQSLQKLLAILYRDRNDYQCQRIAIVFTKCEQTKLWPWSLQPQALAKQYFPQVHQQLQTWEERGSGKFEYFSTSAFGTLGNYQPETNAIDIDPNQAVLNHGQSWQPFGLLAPIYWLTTGKRHHKLDFEVLLNRGMIA